MDGRTELALFFPPFFFFLLLQNRQLAGFYFPHSSSSRMQCARIHIPFCLVKPQQQTHKLVSNCTWRFVCEGGNETGKKTKPISHPDCKGMRNTSTRERERERYFLQTRERQHVLAFFRLKISQIERLPDMPARAILPWPHSF